MKIQYHIYLALLLFIASLSAAHAQNANSLYNQYNKLNTEELMDRGCDFYTEHKGNEALICFGIIINRYSDNQSDKEKERCASALNNRGCVYKYSFFDYAHAYDDMFRALKMCEQYHLDELYPKVCVNLGTLLNDYCKQFPSSVIQQQALDVFERGYNGALELKNWDLAATTFVNVAEFNHNIQLNKYKALFSPEAPDTARNMRYARLLYRAIESIQHKDYGKAIKYFEQQLDVVDNQDTPERITISSLINIASTHMIQHDYAPAIEHLLRAEQLAWQYQVEDMGLQVYGMLSNGYSQMNNTAKFNQYHLMYLEKKDSLSRVNQLASVGEQNFVMELKQEEKRYHELSTQRRIQNIIMALLGVIIAIILGFTVVIRRKNRQLTARNKVLYEHMQDIMKSQEEQHILLKQIESSNSTPQPAEREKYSGSNLGEEDKDKLMQRILEIMNTPDIICQQGFSISQLAQLVGSNTSYVSQVINERYGYSFNILLGNNRIIEVCRLLRDEEYYGKLTLEAISQNAGFKSRGTFVTAFKRVVGLTPSEYLRMAKNES